MTLTHQSRFRGLMRFGSTCCLALAAAACTFDASAGRAQAQDGADVVSAPARAADQAAPAALAADPMDWPNWRGPQQTSTSTEKGLIEKWNPKGGPNSNLLWKRSDLGTRSTPIVMGGNLYVLVRDKPGSENEREKVVCVNAETGEQLWEYAFNVCLTEVPDTRVGWSSVVGDPQTGRIYAQGVSGYFCCLEGDSGKLVWDHSLAEELGAINTFGGRTNVPVLFDDLVLISAVVVGWGDAPEFDALARPSHRFMAFDKATGELRWLNGTSISPPDTTYSTPFVGVVGGEAQLIFGSSDGLLWSFQPRTGKHLWSYPLSERGLNVSPLVVGNMVYSSHSEENLVGTTQGAAVALDATQRGDLAGKEKWLAYTIMAGKSSPLMVDGKLWLVDDRAKLQILDAETGDPIAKKALGTTMRSTPVLGDGKVYTCTNAGQWYILRPTDTGVEVVHKLRLNGDESDGSPIISHGRIYLPTSNAIYCIGAKDAKPEAGALPDPPAETPLEADAQVAHVQVAPYDALVKPGETHKFAVRLFNARGQLLRTATPEEATFRVEGPGEVAADGTYTAPKRAGHVGALVYCKVGALEGKARVRVVPPLPWQFDFNKIADLPITWVGGRFRYVIEEIDGERAAKKRSVLPTARDPVNKLGTRSQMYMGPADLSNYTIQADVRINEANGRLPDVGLNNSGYTLSIRAESNELRIFSWSAHDHRTSAAKPFQTSPGLWYRMKLRVEHGKDKNKDTAAIKGKMWLRDQTEPAEWTVEMVDKTPVASGSPGLFGNAQEAEFYVDNLSVTPNQ